MTQPHTQPNPNELLSITREELERCCSQMSAAGYKVSANYVEAMVLSRSHPHTPAAPSERLCDDCNIIELEEKVMRLEQDLKDAHKAERNYVLDGFDW